MQNCQNLRACVSKVMNGQAPAPLFIYAADLGAEVKQIAWLASRFKLKLNYI